MGDKLKKQGDINGSNCAKSIKIDEYSAMINKVQSSEQAVLSVCHNCCMKKGKRTFGLCKIKCVEDFPKSFKERYSAKQVKTKMKKKKGGHFHELKF